MYRDEILPEVLGMGCQDIEFFNLLVGNGDATGGDAASVDKDLASGLGQVT